LKNPVAIIIHGWSVGLTPGYYNKSLYDPLVLNTLYKKVLIFILNILHIPVRI